MEETLRACYLYAAVVRIDRQRAMFSLTFNYAQQFGIITLKDRVEGISENVHSYFTEVK